jgi:phosphoglycolate phosphatase
MRFAVADWSARPARRRKDPLHAPPARPVMQGKECIAAIWQFCDAAAIAWVHVIETWRRYALEQGSAWKAAQSPRYGGVSPGPIAQLRRRDARDRPDRRLVRTRKPRSAGVAQRWWQAMYSDDRLIILDADGTTIDAFGAIERTFAIHDMAIGDLERFQKRRHLFKYLGGLKEFPVNLRRQIGKQRRRQLIETLTAIYREEARLYEPLGPWITRLIAEPGLRVGLVTRNITNDPMETLRCLLGRHGVDADGLDFLDHVSLDEDKTGAFRRVRERFNINPARAFACGDEKKDFVAARATGMHPFMVSYGFEDFQRLTRRIGVPAELISPTPAELRRRVSHALDLDAPPATGRSAPHRGVPRGLPALHGNGEAPSFPVSVGAPAA